MIKNVLKGYRHVDYGGQFDIYFTLDGEELEMTGMVGDKGDTMYVSCTYLEEGDWGLLGLEKPSVYRVIGKGSEGDIHSITPDTALTPDQLASFLKEHGVLSDDDEED